MINVVLVFLCQILLSSVVNTVSSVFIGISMMLQWHRNVILILLIVIEYGFISISAQKQVCELPEQFRHLKWTDRSSKVGFASKSRNFFIQFWNKNWTECIENRLDSR